MKSHNFSPVFTMARKDFFHEAKMSFCNIIGLASILAPLLVLFSLKYGIVSSMNERLFETAVNREIRPYGHGLYTDDWLKQLDRKSEIEYIIPSTRWLAAQMTLVNTSNIDAEPFVVQMLPSTKGDPLLLEWKLPEISDFDIILSYQASAALKVKVGEHVEARVGRLQDQRLLRFSLPVVGILHRSISDHETAYVSLDFLLASEMFRENESVPGFDIEGTLNPKTQRNWSYASFRAYVRSIDGVEPIVHFLEQQGIRVVSKLDKIKDVQQLDKVLSLLFLILAGLSSVGFIVAMNANLLAMVIRKQNELSIMRLLGFSTYSIALFPVIQAMFIAILGFIVALGIYFSIEPAVNWLFDEKLQVLFENKMKPNESICRLLPEHISIALGITLSIALLSALSGGIKASKISPSDGLRHE